jgi:hypothetical protein
VAIPNGLALSGRVFFEPGESDPPSRSTRLAAAARR